MSTPKNMIIQHFSNRYLKANLPKELDNISEILDLPLHLLKYSLPEDLKILEKYDITSIRDLSKKTSEDIQRIAKTTQINETNLENYYIASQLIKRAWQKRAAYGTKEFTKVCVIGLDNAGKTTIISLLKGNQLSQAVHQEPTIDVNRLELSSKVINMVLWDFAGQSDFRNKYFDNPEEFFLQMDIVIYVVDSQARDRYDEALIYLQKIVKTISFLGEKPYFLFMLHKYDPEFRDDPEFEISIDYLKEKIGETMKTKDFQYDMITSSIFSAFQGQPEIVVHLKETFKQEKDNPNLLLIDVVVKLTENLFTIGERILDGQQKIMQLITESKSPQLYREDKAEFGGKNDLIGVKPSDIAKAALQNEFTPESPNAEKNVLDELKSMFRKVDVIK